MKMKMYSFVLLATAFATVAVYGEPIDLGCNGRGPLAALESSAAFRKAIGAGNPANFLSGVYDVNGQKLSPGSSKALQCPLFIDSNAEPSASASKAILMAETRVRAEEPKEQAIAPAQNAPIMVVAAAGVVAQFPQPEVQKAETLEGPQAPVQAATGRVHKGRVAKAASVQALENQQVLSETSEPAQELTVHALAVPSPQQVEEKRERISSAGQSQKNEVLSFAEAIGLIRQVRTGAGVGSLEFNPVMVFFDFAALFSAVLAFCLLIVHPGFRTAVVNHNTVDRYREVLMRGIDPQAQAPVHFAPRRASRVSAQAAMSLTHFANLR
jgi:hypothetical protein